MVTTTCRYCGQSVEVRGGQLYQYLAPHENRNGPCWGSFKHVVVKEIVETITKW